MDDARSIINLKNALIVKMKNYIMNFMTAAPSANTIMATGGLSDVHQNLIEYLKYENDRLENKLLLLQTELNVEKTRSEQMKEVIYKLSQVPLNEINYISGLQRAEKTNDEIEPFEH